MSKVLGRRWCRLQTIFAITELRPPWCLEVIATPFSVALACFLDALPCLMQRLPRLQMT